MSSLSRIDLAANSLRREAAMAEKAAKEPTVDVKVARAGSSRESLARQEPLIDIKTGLTEGNKYFIKVTPTQGRPVLIAVHL
jgi:hypothetical protein